MTEGDKMINFIDANCMVGKRMKSQEGVPQTASELSEVMNRSGISRAIVYHCMASETDIIFGNRILDAEIKDFDCFMKQWVVMPDFLGEISDADRLLEKMKENNVKTVRIMPQKHGYSVKPYSIGKFINTLSECNIPIFIDKAQVSFDEIYSLGTDYPDASFVVCEPGYRSARQYAPILDACPNIYLETSNYCHHNGIRDICRTYGANRLIFGSGMPNGSGTAATSIVRYSDISEEEKEMIASGNILKLLEEVSL